jgi:hypothetical protein
MKQQIPASAIAGVKGFSVAAAAHAFELKSWRAHMARVADDEMNDVPIERRHVAYPRPRAHPLVERAVDENDEVDFEIVDDGPTAEEKLAARKVELFHEVSIAEHKAIDAVVPTAKRRFFNLREAAILDADRTKSALLWASNAGLVKKVTGAAMSADQIAARVESERPAGDTTFLREQTERTDRLAAIQLAAAKAHHDIEDLTAETVGGWKLPTF